MKQADFRDMFEKASESVYTSTIVCFLLHLLLQLRRLQKIPQQGPDDPEPADEGHILMEYSSA
jgi:hypothetical protein